MAKLTKKWISNSAVDHTKIDAADTYTLGGLQVTADATVGANLKVTTDLTVLQATHLSDSTTTGHAEFDGPLVTHSTASLASVSVVGLLQAQSDSSVVGNQYIGGRVGIGSSRPTVPLDVVGNTAVAGTITATGSITGSGFTGSGANITGVPYSALSGTPSLAPLVHSHVIADVTGLQTVLDSLQSQISYVPLVINSFTNTVNQVEQGATISSVTLNWAITGTVVSQSINQGIGAVISVNRTATYSTPFNSNLTFSLSVVDAKPTTFTASTSVLFYLRRYWGFSANTTLTTGQVLTLGNSEYATNYVKSLTISGSGLYWFYCIPAAWGEPTFSVGGLAVGFIKQANLAHTNSSGYTSFYNIYRTPNPINGSNLSVVVS